MTLLNCLLVKLDWQLRVVGRQHPQQRGRWALQSWMGIWAVRHSIHNTIPRAWHSLNITDLTCCLEPQYLEQGAHGEGELSAWGQDHYPWWWQSKKEARMGLIKSQQINEQRPRSEQSRQRYFLPQVFIYLFIYLTDSHNCYPGNSPSPLKYLTTLSIVLPGQGLGTCLRVIFLKHRSSHDLVLLKTFQWLLIAWRMNFKFLSRLSSSSNLFSSASLAPSLVTPLGDLGEPHQAAVLISFKWAACCPSPVALPLLILSLEWASLSPGSGKISLL